MHVRIFCSSQTSCSTQGQQVVFFFTSLSTQLIKYLPLRKATTYNVLVKITDLNQYFSNQNLHIVIL